MALFGGRKMAKNAGQNKIIYVNIHIGYSSLLSPHLIGISRWIWCGVYISQDVIYLARQGQVLLNWERRQFSDWNILSRQHFLVADFFFFGNDGNCRQLLAFVPLLVAPCRSLSLLVSPCRSNLAWRKVVGLIWVQSNATQKAQTHQHSLTEAEKHKNTHSGTHTAASSSLAKELLAALSQPPLSKVDLPF